MKVKLKFKTAEGKCYKMSRETTVKEATEYYEEHLKKKPGVTKVWLTHFDGWHHYLYKVLYEV